MAQDLVRRPARKVDFSDSEVIVVQTVVDKLRDFDVNDVSKTNGGIIEQIDGKQRDYWNKMRNEPGKNGFSRLDMVGGLSISYFLFLLP
jgi:hypothetical protein